MTRGDGERANRQLEVGMTPRLHRAVICDMDGLLIDSEPLYRRAWQAAASQLGFDLSDAAYAALIGITESSSEARLLEMFGREFPLPRFREAWRENWRGLMAADELRAKQGARALLESLQASLVRLALATSSGESYARISLEHVGFDGFFEHVVTADQVRNGKPAPDLYLEAARRIGVAPEACLVLEDSPTGAAAGLAAGMTVILVPDLQPPTAAILARVAAVHADLDAARPSVLRALADAGSHTSRSSAAAIARSGASRVRQR